jgi:hypothetical protein
MKVKLTAPDYTTYTGPLGVTEFENGVSVSDDVPPIDAARIASVVAAEWEDGEKIAPSGE